MNTTNTNRSAQRCLALLRAFRGSAGKTLSELSREVGLPHPTVIRFLNTLSQEGYVRKENTVWTLTPQVLELGFAAMESMGVTEAVQDILQRLAVSCSGTANLGEQMGDHIVIIGRAIAAAEMRKLIIMNLRVGSTLPADSALYGALAVAEDQWCIAQYPQGNHVSVAIPVKHETSRALTLGLSMSLADYPTSRIVDEAVPLLQDARKQIEAIFRMSAAF